MISCAKNADRDNPLDPRSREYENFGSIEGQVYTYYEPFQPIASALITLNPGNQTTITNHEGAFAFTNVLPDSYQLAVSYPGYAPDTAKVAVQSKKTTSIRFNLYQTYGILQGHVYTYYAPFQPIASALITLLPGNQTTITNQAGAFVLNDVSPDTYLVAVNYPGYASDTTEVVIQSNRTTSIQFNLDGLPRLEALILNSGFQHEHYPFEPVRMIDVMATVHDPDGPADVASVAVIIPDINFRDTLGVSLDIGTFQKKIEENDFGIDHIEELIGKPFFIEISDKVGNLCRYGPKYLFRVIDDEPEIISPRGSASVGIQPTLKWEALQLPFSFSFKVEIHAISEDQILYPAIYTFSGISSEITEFKLGTTMPSSLYLWFVAIIDQWGNWSRSKPATFQVGE